MIPGSRPESWDLQRVQPDRDVTIIGEMFGSGLDPSAGENGQTSKWGIDATIPLGANRERSDICCKTARISFLGLFILAKSRMLSVAGVWQRFQQNWAI